MPWKTARAKQDPGKRKEGRKRCCALEAGIGAYSAHAMLPSGLSIRKGCLRNAEEKLSGNLIGMLHSHMLGNRSCPGLI